MKKMSKKEVSDIMKNISSNSDIIAYHETNSKNVEKIIKDGLVYEKGSLVILEKKDANELNSCEESANVVVSIPKSFIKQIREYNDEEYSEWIKMINDSDSSEFIIEVFSNVIDDEIRVEEDESELLGLPMLIKCHLPKEFVNGCFIIEKGKIIDYVDNPCFFDRLSLEKQTDFVNDFFREEESME